MTGHNEDVIQSLWIGAQLSPIEQLALRSFITLGHEVHLYTYDQVDGVPRGVTLKDAASILPFDPTFTVRTGFGNGSFAPFADRFRMTLLWKRGGWWVDMDVVCLKPFSGLSREIVAGSWEVPEGNCPNLNVLRLPPQHDICGVALEEWNSISADRLYYGMGVDVLKRAIARLRLGHVVAPHWMFNPISWRQVRYLVKRPEPWFHPIAIKRALGLRERLTMPDTRAYAVHLWNEGWRTAGLEKSATYQSDSLFETLKHRYAL
jgi:hypothetical protein